MRRIKRYVRIAVELSRCDTRRLSEKGIRRRDYRAILIKLKSAKSALNKRALFLAMQQEKFGFRRGSELAYCRSRQACNRWERRFGSLQKLLAQNWVWKRIAPTFAGPRAEL